MKGGVHPTMNSRPIAVFDSGLGGISVLHRLMQVLPEENYLYFGDSLNAPYGSRPTEEIRELTLKNAEELFSRGAKALVVACNTATSAAIDALRSRYPKRIIIGIEPALKLAVSRHSGGKILVMATDATLREKKFSAMSERCAEQCTVLKCPCPALVPFVERGELDSDALLSELEKELSPFLSEAPDAVVLGCTHFPFLKAAIHKVLGNQPELLDGAEGTARETKRRLEEAGLLRTGSPGKVELTNSLQTPEILKLSEKLLSVL